MGIKTEDFVKNLPPKEVTTGINWLGILDSFDPKMIEDKFINECARRNPFETCYKWETPAEPIEGRLRSATSYANFDRRDLEAAANRILNEGLTETVYKNARTALIKAIGQKGAVEYNRREYERLGKEGRKRQAEEYARWLQERDRQRQAEEDEYESAFESGDYETLVRLYGEYGGYKEAVSMHEKVVKIRKGMLGSNGKPLTQREFAKFIGYPINKYAEAEKTDCYGRGRESESEVEFELLEKLIMICHANPFWLFDFECEADYAEYDITGATRMGDAPFVFTTPDVILRWIEAGKPRKTSWKDVRAGKY